LGTLVSTPTLTSTLKQLTFRDGSEYTYDITYPTIDAYGEKVEEREVTLAECIGDL
jgi:hypothetical protein